MKMDTTNDEARWRSERFSSTSAWTRCIRQEEVSSATRDMGQGSNRRPPYDLYAYTEKSQTTHRITAGTSGREETDRRVNAATRNYTWESNL